MYAQPYDGFHVQINSVKKVRLANSEAVETFLELKSEYVGSRFLVRVASGNFIALSHQ